MYNDLYQRKSFASNFELTDFLRQTYQLVGASLLAAAAGTYIGLEMIGYLTGVVKFILIALELVILFFVLPRVVHTPGINLITLFVFTFLTGLTLAPLMSSILALANGASIVGQAFLLTAIAFLGLSFFALTTKKDFSGLTKILFISLIVIIVAAISNIFIQNTMFQLVIASASSILFSVFIIYDTQNIVKGEYSTPIEASISLYLNILNLFTSLLQILGITSGERE